MKKGTILLISALAFGGLIGGTLTSCGTTTEVNTELGATTVSINTHGDFVTCEIENKKETYKEGDKIKLILTFKDGYALESASINGKGIDNVNEVTLEAGKNIIDIYVKAVTSDEGSTNIRDFVFEEDTAGTGYAIVSYTPTGIYPKIATFPSSYLGKPVTEIRFKTKTTENDTIVLSRYSFGGLQGIYIPKTITKIDARVFRMNSTLKQFKVEEGNPNYSSDGTVLLNKDKTTLISFPQGVSGNYKIPDTVTTIGESAFYGAGRLTSIDLNKTTTIEANAFSSLRKIESIVLPDTVTTIGESAFEACVDTKNITLSKNLKDIPEKAFYKCSSLTSIDIPSSVKSIQKYGFYDCTSLKTLNVAEGVEDIGYCAFSHTIIEELNMPKSLKKIGTSCFSGNNVLKAANFQEGIVEFGDMAFYQTLSLAKLNIPSTVTKIGSECFFATLSLKSFDVAENNKTYKAIDGVLFNEAGDTLIAYPSAKDTNIPNKTYTVPAGTKTLGFRCFSAVSNNPVSASDKFYSIEKIVIPTSVISMDESFFMANLREVVYEGTSEEFAKIQMNGKVWDSNSGVKITLTCAGDAK